MNAPAEKRYALTTCPGCDGEGGFWVVEQSRVHWNTVTPPEVWNRCEQCGGEGEIEVEVDPDEQPEAVAS